MPKTRKGSKIMAAMEKSYGERKADDVFYGSVTKGKIKGVLPKKEEQKLRRRYKGGKK